MNDAWNKLCRACLTTRESFKYFLIENVTAETYLFCTSVQIREDEALPKALCDSCYELIRRYSEFKRTCIESQNTLLLCSKTIKAEEIQGIQPISQNEIDRDSTVLEDLESKWDGDFVKQEDLSEHFNEDSLAPELSDESIKKVVLIHKRRKKLKKIKSNTVKCKRKQELVKPHLHYTCDLCNKKFWYHKRFEAHKLEHGSQKDTTLHCLSCNKTFMTVSGLRRHQESAHAAVRLASVSCARCGRVCASKHSLRAHEKMHGSTRAQAVCHVCGKRVSSAIILKAHLETHKADRERRHTCEHCGKKFFTNTILLSHIKRLHTGLRFICGVCDYPFTDKHNLAKHILIHDGKKLYKCDICEKSYATNGSLVEHKRIHSGERPFGCSFCPKSFLSKRRLMDHHRIHTGDKPHRCMICEQRFTQRGTLKRHMKVHDPTKAPILIHS